MNKYYGTQVNYSDDIEWQLMGDESILWKGTPKKGAFILNAATKKMAFALMWLLFDSMFIFVFLGAESSAGGGGIRAMSIFLIGFFALHLMPVWMWIYDIITSFGRWKNTLYVVTTHRVMVRNGLGGGTFDSFSYGHIAQVSVRVSRVDRMSGVGDVMLSIYSDHAGGGVECGILDIEEYQRVYQMIQSYVMQAKGEMPAPY